jgi:hypothetical protein
VCLCGLVSSYTIVGKCPHRPALGSQAADEGQILSPRATSTTSSDDTHLARREWSDDFLVQPSNTVKELLKIQELGFSGAQNGLPSPGKKPPSKPITQRKIQHLWGISLSARTRMSRHILDGYSTSTCGLGARSLQSFPKCPLSQQRRRSGVGLASRMLQNRLGGSMYSKTRGPKGQK